MAIYEGYQLKTLPSWLTTNHAKSQGGKYKLTGWAFAHLVNYFAHPVN